MTRDLTVRVESNGAYWKAIVSLPGGLRKTRSLGPKAKLSKRAAMAQAREYAATIDWRRPSTETGDESFLAWYDKVSEKRKASRSTYQTYKTTRRHVEWFFGDTITLDDINESHAEKFRKYLIDRGYQEQTVRGHCRRAKIAWTEARKLRKVEGDNPFDAIPTATVQVDQEWQYVERDTIRKLVRIMPRTEGISLMVARFAGLRLGEIQRLQWEDIHLASRIIRVVHEGKRTTKRRARSVPIDPELYEYLSVRKGTGLVASAATRSRGSAAYSAIRATISAAGLPSIDNPYQDCRKSCITDWCNVVPVTTVAKIAGNSVAVIESNYHKVLASQLAKITGQIAPNLPQDDAPNAILSDHYAAS